MTHEHFHCFVDLLLARPVVDCSDRPDDETGSVIDGSVAEVRRLQDVNADMLEALQSLTKDPPATLDEPDPDWEVITKMRAIARAAVAKAEGKS